MLSFSADWLALREPADARSRSAPLSAAIADSLPRERPVEVLDLAAGTGSNARYLNRFMRTPSVWLLVDRDATLLDLARRSVPGHIATRVADLSRLDADTDIFTGRDLVTASALLDLVSETWLAEVLDRCREERAAVLWALTYDGRMRCAPEEPEDGRIRELVNSHQRSDKGFGRALGPDAGTRAVSLLEARGYNVSTDASDWIIEPDAHRLQQQVIDGWADAAADLAPDEREWIGSWRGRRLAHVHHNRSRITVGHRDVGGILKN